MDLTEILPRGYFRRKLILPLRSFDRTGRCPPVSMIYTRALVLLVILAADFLVFIPQPARAPEPGHRYSRRTSRSEAKFSRVTLRDIGVHIRGPIQRRAEDLLQEVHSVAQSF